MTSPGWKKLEALFGWVLALGVISLLWRPIRLSNDLWWHLATGRYILATHQLPMQDVFSWTMAGHAWINHEWLFDIISFSAYRLGGVTGLLLLKTLLILAALGLPWRFLTFMRVPWTLRGLVLFLAFWASRHGWNVRADLVSLAFASALCWTLQRYRQTGDFRLLRPWPFLFVLWANLHGGFILGLAVMTAFFAALSLEKKGKRRWIAVLGLCGVATLVNPWGWRLHQSTLEALIVLRHAGISEWARTPWWPMEFFWPCLFLFWGLVAWRAVFVRSPLWADIFLGALLSYGAVQNIRNVPLFMVCAFPLTGAWLARWPPLASFFNRSIVKVSTCIAVIFMIGISLARIATGVDTRTLPVEVCEFIDQQRLPLRLYNDYRFGGYWLWRFGTRRPTFIDGRFHAVDGYPTLLKDIERAKEQNPGAWEAFLTHWGAEGAVVAYADASPLPSVFHLYFPRERWALVYWDDQALVFLRRLPALKALIKQHEFPAVDPDAKEDFLRARLHRSPELAQRIRQDLLRNQQLHPDSLRVRRLLEVIGASQAVQ